MDVPVTHSRSELRTSETPLQTRTAGGLSIQQHTQNAPNAVSTANAPASGPVDDDFDPTPWAINTEPKFLKALNGLIGGLYAPALAVGSVEVNQPPVIHAVGIRKEGHLSKVTKVDRFLWPISDLLLPTLLAILIEKNILSWEDTLPAVLPRLAKRMHVFHHETTMKMVACNRTGIKGEIHQIESGQLSSYLCQPDVTGQQGRFAVGLSVLTRPPDESPGKYTWSYLTNILLTLVLEERTSRPIDALLKQYIFDPLEMYHSRLGLSGQGLQSPSILENPDRPLSHSSNGHFVTWEANFSTTCDPYLGIFAPMNDVLSFCSLHLRGSMGLPTPILTPESFAILHAGFDERWSKNTPTPGGWFSFDQAVAGDWTGVGDWTGGNFLHYMGEAGGYYVKISVARKVGLVYAAVANSSAPRGKKSTQEALTAFVRYDKATGKLKE
jgi:CubicO group peptidase (beta-lactamase class C family)